jgi:hypothetical protein
MKRELVDCILYFGEVFAGFEGIQYGLPEANYLNPLSILRRAAFNLSVDVDELRNSDRAERMLSYIHCWVGSAVQTEYMWDEYGDYGTGVCIKTTGRRLKKALIEKEGFFVEL